MLYLLLSDGTRVPIEPFTGEDPTGFVPVSHLPIEFHREVTSAPESQDSPTGERLDPG